MKIDNMCALEKIRKLKDNSQDIIYADPPYALGSTVLIGEDGKPYYKEAKDFMGKWEMPDEKFWEEFFKEASRVLKYGGRVLFFGIDRQLMLFQYYATLAKLETKQSLYWYFISNFPKATDLSKQIDKRLREDSEVLVKKYDGYKYSISPLKKVLETVMVFQKQTKNKSVLDDVFAFEDGDETISPGIWNIDAGRVATSDKWNGNENLAAKEGNTFKSIDLNSRSSGSNDLGRFPPQLLIDKECAKALDEQSGEEVGGCSKILHKIEYLDEELNILMYSPKVSSFERELWCNEFNDVKCGTGALRDNGRGKVSKNSHPTLKPIKLNYQIAKLLKTPNKQRVFFPFSGAGSEIIGFIQAGFEKDLFECSEINTEFVEIAQARIEAWKHIDIEDIETTKKHIDSRNEENENQGSLF